MDYPLEKVIVGKIIRYLKGLPRCYFMKTHGDKFSRAGVPDIVGCLGGRYFGLEVKRPGGVTTKLQDHELGKIKAAGGVAAVVFSVEGVEVAFAEITEKRPLTASEAETCEAAPEPVKRRRGRPRINRGGS